MKKYLFVYLATLCCLCANAVDIKRYVKEGGTGDGLTWETASGDLQTILDLATRVDNLDVIVGSGTFTGNFNIKGNTRVMGLFDGEDGYINRELKTLLVGTIKLEGVLCYAHVKGCVKMDQAVMLEVTVYGSQEYGIEIYNSSGESRLVKCTVFECKYGCKVDGNGRLTMEKCAFCFNERGGFYARNGIVIAYNCSFSENKGIGCELSNPGSSCLFNNCWFSKNEKGGFKGGGISGSHILNRCRIGGNTSTEEGAGIYATSNVVVNNSIICNNESTHQKGSAIYLLGPNNSFSNCTVVSNLGGVYIEEGFKYTKATHPLMTNCVLWNNKEEFINPANCTYTLEHCAIEGGTGIPELDAERGILALSSENEGTEAGKNYPMFAGDLSLMPNSCLINKGKILEPEMRDYYNATCNALGGCDIGAVEYQGEYKWVAGVAPVTIDKDVYKLASTTYKGVTYYSLLHQYCADDEGNLQTKAASIYLGTKRNSYTVVAGTPFIGLYREGKIGQRAKCNILEWDDNVGWKLLEVIDYTAGKDKPALKKDATRKNHLNAIQLGRTSIINPYENKRY